MISGLKTMLRHVGRRWYICVFIVCLAIFLIYRHNSVMPASMPESGQKPAYTEPKPLKAAESYGPYAADLRLRFACCEEIAYEEVTSPLNFHIYNRHMGIFYRYSEEEIEMFKHSSFDEQNRMTYMLGYSESSILSGRNSYCEENIYEWDDVESTCRYIYYKSTGVPYDGGFFVGYRYMFDVSNYTFTEDNKLLKLLNYSRNVGSDKYGYSEELFFNRGYQADYDKDLLMTELECYNYWGTNEAGTWEFCAYQYDKEGNCILKVLTTEEEITVYAFEYDFDNKSVIVYQYIAEEDWELPCNDGSTIYFSPNCNWADPAVRLVTSKGDVERELFYGKVIDMGQQDYLMPEEVEDTVMDHKYVVEPSDCLWDIADRYYGDGMKYSLLHTVNRAVVGWDPELILPGTRLFIPEIENF